MNLDVTVRAVRILSVLVVLRTGRLIRAHAVRVAVTRQTELRYAASNQQTRIGGTMRCVTRNAPFRFYWCMFVNKGTLLVDVTLDAGCVRSGGEPGLFELETAVRIVAVAAPHRAFQHLVMERQVELVLGFHVTAQAELRFAVPEQLHIGEARLLRVGPGNEHIGGSELTASRLRVGRVAIGATDVVAPVFAAAEVVVFLAAGVTRQTRLGNLLRRFILEGDDLFGVAFFDVRFAWTMARLATRHLFFPATQLRELRVGSV